MRRVLWLACGVLAATSSLSAQDLKFRITLSGHTNVIESVAFSPDGKTLASTGQDQTIKIWDVAAGTNVATLKLADDDGEVEVHCVAFSPDGKTMASGSSEGTVKLWDVVTGKNTSRFNGHDPGCVLSTAFSPCGDTIAAGGDTGTIKLWNVANGKCNFTRDHPGLVVSVVFSPDGKTLASASECNDIIKLWSVATGENIATLKDVGGYGALSVAFSPDGKTLASGGFDRIVRLWDSWPLAIIPPRSRDISVSFIPWHSARTARSWRQGAETRLSSYGTWPPARPPPYSAGIPVGLSRSRLARMERRWLLAVRIRRSSSGTMTPAKAASK